MSASGQCAITECEKRAYQRGWCSAHYNRWRRHGDPRGGNRSRGAALRFLKETVLNYEGDECFTWPFNRSKDGRGQIKYNGRQAVVSRVVCEIVHGPPPTPEHLAAHSCGKGHLGCVTKRHLIWKTQVENMADTIPHGTRLRGEKNASAKLSASDVHQIRSLQRRLSQREIAARYGVSRETISDIMTGKRWGWLEPGLSLAKHGST